MVINFVINLFHFKIFLYYLKAQMMDLEQVDPHLMQQYEPGEDEFVTKYIYLENFSTEIIRLEQIYQLKTSLYIY